MSNEIYIDCLCQKGLKIINPPILKLSDEQYLIGNLNNYGNITITNKIELDTLVDAFLYTPIINTGEEK